MKYIFAGDSWALKGFTEQNYHFGNNDPMLGDKRLADYWGLDYQYCLTPGKGNLSVLDKLLSMDIDANVPIIWVYTEPGRDYGKITGDDEFNWIRSEQIFGIREELDKTILTKIRSTLDNPIALIGGLSDVTIELAESLGYEILHPSWQKWISERLERAEHFTFGWGASDIGWRMDYNNVKPSKAAVFAWDDLIKEWCMWEDLGYFSHEHPTPLANEEFAEHLKPYVINWLEKCQKVILCLPRSRCEQS